MAGKLPWDKVYLCVFAINRGLSDAAAGLHAARESAKVAGLYDIEKAASRALVHVVSSQKRSRLALKAAALKVAPQGDLIKEIEEMEAGVESELRRIEEEATSQEGK